MSLANQFTWFSGFPKTASSDALCTPPIHARLGGQTSLSPHPFWNWNPQEEGDAGTSHLTPLSS